jgi:hypothetical protein
MPADDIDFAPSLPEAAEDLFDMANLYPRDTGLPMTMWVSPRGHARHDVRIKVCMTPGDRMDTDNTAVGAVRPTPRLLHGHVAAADLARVAAWIGLNESALVGYWDGKLSPVEFVTRAKVLPPD